MLGELSLVSDGVRSATAVALEEAQTLALHRDDFEEMVREHPAVQRFLVNLLADQVSMWVCSQLTSPEVLAPSHRMGCRHAP